jgi:hypothetical protein
MSNQEGIMEPSGLKTKKLLNKITQLNYCISPLPNEQLPLMKMFKLQEQKLSIATDVSVAGENYPNVKIFKYVICKKGSTYNCKRRID